MRGHEDPKAPLSLCEIGRLTTCFFRFSFLTRNQARWFTMLPSLGSYSYRPWALHSRGMVHIIKKSSQPQYGLPPTQIYQKKQYSRLQMKRRNEMSKDSFDSASAQVSNLKKCETPDRWGEWESAPPSESRQSYVDYEGEHVVLQSTAFFRSNLCFARSKLQKLPIMHCSLLLLLLPLFLFLRIGPLPSRPLGLLRTTSLP